MTDPIRSARLKELLAAKRAAPVAEAEAWYARGMDVYLNRWFTTYADARRALETEGGYLFPFRQQFFVCAADAVRHLGLDPDDPDWERIGRDCARPADGAAFERLRRARKAGDWKWI